ncbi:TatD family hydrolase [Halanaerocella petrolearia]
MLVDTHAHLDFPRFDNDRDKVIQDAYRLGVKQVINVGADMESSRNSVELAKEYNFISASVGVHPHEAKSFTDEDYQELKKLASQSEVVAIGEMGLDYHYDNSPRQKQQEVFRKQLQLAKEVDLPVVIHSREAREDTLEILKEEAKGSEGVLHCFGYDLEVAREVIDLGFYVALGGVLTFGSAQELRMTVPNLSLDRVLIETDAPYLTPEPHRGERNEPKYVKEVAKKIAELKNTSLEKVAEQTTNNAKELFELD